MDTKTRPLYMLLTRDPPQNKGHIQTESEGVASSLETQREGGREPSLQGKPLGSEQTLPRLSRLHHWELHTSPRYRPDLYVYSSLQASQVAQWKGSCLQWRKCGLHPWVRKIPLPFTLLFWVRVYTSFLCFLSRKYPLAFVGELVWWC